MKGFERINGAWTFTPPAGQSVNITLSDGGKLSFAGAAPSLDFSSTSPTSHPLNFSSITLPASSNVIRGTSIAPTRTSG